MEYYDQNGKQTTSASIKTEGFHFPNGGEVMTNGQYLVGECPSNGRLQPRTDVSLFFRKHQP